MGTELEFTEGMQFDKGYISPYFVTDPSAWRPSSTTPTSCCTRARSPRSPTCCRCWRRSSQAGKPLFILAEDVEGEALSTLVVNKIRGTFNAVAVKAPAFGDRRKAMLQDIAMLTGGQVVAPEVGLKLDQVGLDVLGTARRVVVTKDDTTIVDGGGDAGRGRGPRQPDQGRDREHRLRLGPREAPGAAREAGRRRLRRSRSAPPPRWSSRRRSTASRTPSPRPAPRSRRASSPAVAPRWSTRPRCSTTTSASPATRPSACASCARPLDEPLRWIAENGGVNGYVVVAKVREGGAGNGYNAATERVRRPGRPGRPRPGQGDPLRAGQRDLDRGHAAHDRDAGRGQARGRGRPSAAGRPRSRPRPLIHRTASLVEASEASLEPAPIGRFRAVLAFAPGPDRGAFVAERPSAVLTRSEQPDTRRPSALSYSIEAWVLPVAAPAPRSRVSAGSCGGR